MTTSLVRARVRDVLGAWAQAAKGRALAALAAQIRRTPNGTARRLMLERLAETGFFGGAYDLPFEIETRFGMKLGGRTGDVLQAHLFTFGEWEPDLTRFVAGRLGPGDTFADVGANIGYFTLLGASRVGPSGRVVAIEASPAVARRLTANLERNELRGVRVVNEAASDTEGWLTLHEGPAWNSGMSSTVAPEAWRRAGIDAAFQRPIEVPARPLDRLLSAAELARLRLIKVDVEGAEHRAVRGMERLLREAPRELELIVEINPELLRSQGAGADALIGALAEAGFHAYTLPADYGVTQYLDPERRPPRRLRGPLLGTADVIFSRLDAEHLG